MVVAINQTNFTKKYDYISLLIGVNNQFNSRPIDEFEEDLNKLMDEMKRRGINEPDLITNDNLHPSGIMYLEWAKKIYNIWID